MGFFRLDPEVYARHKDDVLRLSNSFQRGFEVSTGADASEVWPYAIAAEGEEVKLTRVVEALQSPRHGRRLSPQLG